MTTVEINKTPNKYVTVSSQKTVSVITEPTEKLLQINSPGVAGPPNVLSVGTVSVSTTPLVTITGTTPTQTINFTLPISGSYVHNQSSSLATWVITHNLNYYPSVTTVDSGDSVVLGDVLYISVNSLSVSFSAAFGGKAYLS